MHAYLNSERPIAELEGKIVELRKLAEEDPAMQIDAEVGRLQARADGLIRDTYAKLTPWQKVQVARHPGRPHSPTMRASCSTSSPRSPATGPSATTMRSSPRSPASAAAPSRCWGHEKGNDTKTRLKHNFGMAMPEGYRKAERIFAMADRFGLPVLSLVDTAGAFNGVAAEERGQSEAIARSTQAGLEIKVPFVTTIIGEGRLRRRARHRHRQQGLHAGAFGLFGDLAGGLRLDPVAQAGEDQEAAAAMRISAQDCLNLKVIDAIIPEPVGGAHRAPEEAILAVGEQIARALARWTAPRRAAPQGAREKYLAMGRDLMA